MSLEKNRAIIRKVIEAVNKRNLALLDELIAQDFFYHTHTQQIQGLEVMKQVIEEESKGFPDLRVTIEDIIAEGDKVWILEKVTGTHTGEWSFLGITFAPTGKKITWKAVNIYRIVDGKVVERKSVRDMLDFLKQLGVIEYTEKAKELFPEDVS